MIEGRPRESLVQFENPTEVGEIDKHGEYLPFCFHIVK